MQFNSVTQVYFSPNGTTEKVIQTIARGLSAQTITYDLLRNPLQEDVQIAADSLLIVAMPVYAGRIPALCREMISHLKGSKRPAIAVVVYGNRDYDDALLELKDLLVQNDFCVVAAGAFIAQHSIFPQVGAGRPDEEDNKAMAAFAQKCSALVAAYDPECTATLNVKGNPQYRAAGNVALKPTGDSKCTECGACVKLCPTHSIPANDPQQTNKETCISCGACIHVCPVQSRAFRGADYELTASKFNKNCAEYKKPEVFYLE